MQPADVQEYVDSNSLPLGNEEALRQKRVIQDAEVRGGVPSHMFRTIIIDASGRMLPEVLLMDALKVLNARH